MAIKVEGSWPALSLNLDYMTGTSECFTSIFCFIVSSGLRDSVLVLVLGEKHGVKFGPEKLLFCSLSILVLEKYS